ncbi:DUF4347 domain-containing protein [Muricauda sp. TY007]|uniref:DUF4347 domain-containing protein n=1 Tax=Allomuricauda sp. TY007 TaxID=2683200 RepID=UPI0013C0C63A|nr:DUF4347 domain-containing protein [Muricauda sp. TY007]NDV17402.1 DUF4347 domain-containing protein [Muricauda sp. TY007]
MKNFFSRKTSLSFMLFFSMAIGISMAQTDDVVIMDSSFPNSGGLIASLPINVGLVEANTTATLSQTLKQALTKNPDVKSIHLFVPTGEKSFTLGGQIYTADTLQQLSSEVFQANSDVTLFVYSCSLAKNNDGKALLETMASNTGFNVASSATCDNLNEAIVFDFSIRPLTITSNLFE